MGRGGRIVKRFPRNTPGSRSKPWTIRKTEGAIMKNNANTVRVNLHRGMKMLREKLGK